MRQPTNRLSKACIPIRWISLDNTMIRAKNLSSFYSHTCSPQQAFEITFNDSFCRRPIIAELYHANSEADNGLPEEHILILAVSIAQF